MSTSSRVPCHTCPFRMTPSISSALSRRTTTGPTSQQTCGEILRVLKPGGRLVIIAETYKGSRFDALYRPVMKLLRATYLSLGEHRDLFSAAGFAEIAVSEERRNGWICAVGSRPINWP